MNSVELVNVSKHYKRFVRGSSLKDAFTSVFNRQYETIKAVNDVTFNLERGIVTGLLGLNGAGKSTLIKIISGIIPPTTGEVHVFGLIPSHKNNSLKKRISVVLGKKSLLWWDISPDESFNLIAKMYDIKTNELNFRKKLFSELLNLGHVLKTPIRNLSLGERMKCELAAALLHYPEFIILDEPTIGLDLHSQIAIRLFLKEYAKKYSATILMSSHSTDDITELCDDIIVLKCGKLCFQGPLHSLKHKFNEMVNITVKFDELKSQQMFLNQHPDARLTDQTVIISIHSSEKINFLKKVAVNFPISDISTESIDVNKVIVDWLT
jgi:ABC-2 type transport system ATP-binding protein